MEILRANKDWPTNPCYQFAELVDEYGDALYKFCRSLTYSQEDADDLFQETFLQAFKRWPGLNAADNPQGLFFSTSLFIWKSWKRKYARRSRLVPLAPLTEDGGGVSAGINVEDGLLAQEEAQIVRKVVQALPDKFKIPVILYYGMEMGVPDIALTLKLPEGTVKSRLFKARKLIEKGLVAADED